MRKKYIGIRKGICDKDKKSHDIFKKASSLPCIDSAKKVAIYSNLPSEVDTKELIDNLLSRKKEVYLPKVYVDEMEFFRILSPADFSEKGSFGIYEPQGDESMKLKPDELDAVIMPGICFDLFGNRIGFGKGYYDKYLHRASGAVKVALCFEEQLLKSGEIPASPYDIKADIIVTQSGIYTLPF